MNRYKRTAFCILCMELLLIILCNVICIFQSRDIDARIYRVEAQRATAELQKKGAGDIDLSSYQSIVRIDKFKAGEICNNDYLVVEAGGILYRIEYRQSINHDALIYANIGMGIMLWLTVFLLLYVWLKILKPFHHMSDLTYELAKGNLAAPVKEEKSKFFGRFLWGMDMLRENLEMNKQKELELQKEKKTLILSLSHDIKTPLSAIELYAKALSSNLYDTEEKKAEALCGIERNVEEIKQYVNEIAAASREDFLNLEVKPGEFYLFQMMNKIEAYYQDKLSVIHTNLLIEKMDDCILKGDADRVVEVLQNIMENAIKYGDGKYIRIFASEEEDCKLIHVENSGCELKTEELFHIFDSFYRGSNSQNIKGSGLGLYIAKNLMRKMSGDLYAQVEDGRFIASVVVRKA